MKKNPIQDAVKAIDETTLAVERYLKANDAVIAAQADEINHLRTILQHIDSITQQVPWTPEQIVEYIIQPEIQEAIHGNASGQSKHDTHQT